MLFRSVADINLPLEHELQVLHIVREALANIALHSSATSASLEVSYSGRHYFFTIEDNGVGMHNVAPIEGHYGLKIMRERAYRIGGEIKMDSLKNQGTRVQLRLPDTES